MIEKTRAEGTTFVADGGDLFWKSGVLSAEDVPQQREKARLQASAYALAGIDAMLPAEGDFALGRDFVEALSTEFHLPYVASDLRCNGEHLFPPVRVVERDGVTIAFVGLVGGNVEVDGCTRDEAGAALKAALTGVIADAVVLLSGENEPDTLRDTQAAGHIDLILVNDRKQLHAAEPVEGGALRLGAGSRGRYVGALSFTLVPGARGWRDDSAIGKLAEQRDRYQQRLAEFQAKLDAPGPTSPTVIEAADRQRDLGRARQQVDFYTKRLAALDAQLAAATSATGTTNRAANKIYTLDAAIADHAATQALVDAAKIRIAAAAAAPTAPTGDSPFAGNTACASCHAVETAQWKTTPHARAWDSLVTVNRQLDDACYSCHVTGALHPEGPRNAASAMAASLQAVGCESCHGPGRAHAAAPTTEHLRKDPAVGVCTECHDGVQDQGRFDLASYRPRILHLPALPPPPTEPPGRGSGRSP